MSTAVKNDNFELQNSEAAYAKGLIPFVTTKGGTVGLKVSYHKLSGHRSYHDSKDPAKKAVVFVVNHTVNVGNVQRYLNISGTPADIDLALRNAKMPTLDAVIPGALAIAITADNYANPEQQNVLAIEIRRAKSILDGAQQVKKSKDEKSRADFLTSWQAFGPIAGLYAAGGLSSANIEYHPLGSDGTSKGSRAARGEVVEIKYSNLKVDFVLNVTKMEIDTGKGSVNMKRPKGNGNKTSKFVGSGLNLRIMVDPTIGTQAALNKYIAAAQRISKMNKVSYEEDIRVVQQKLNSSASVVPASSVAGPRATLSPMQQYTATGQAPVRMTNIPTFPTGSSQLPPGYRQ
jgi:hypothetical protein